MQIVIDIPEEDYKFIKDLQFYHSGRRNGRAIEQNVINGIRNGTPLPKGHGRLIDADEALIAMGTWEKFDYTETGCLVRNPGNDYVPYVHYEDMVKAVSDMPTIIEADTEAEND